MQFALFYTAGMFKRFCRRAPAFFLFALSLTTSSVFAEGNAASSPVFTDTNALNSQLFPYQKSMFEQPQDVFERGLQNLLKGFPRTTYQLFDPQPPETIGEPVVDSGLSWIARGSEWYVREVYPESAGDRAGVQVGDHFLGIDTPTTVKTPADLCRGQQPVYLRIERSGRAVKLSFSCQTFTRLSMITRMIEGHTGYLRPDFERLGSVSLLKQVFNAVTSLQEQGMTRLVLDLRGNQGGSIYDVATMADMFLHQGVIVRLLDRDGERKVSGRTEQYPRSAKNEREDIDVPLVVLVNKETQAGAELLAADLKQNGRAKVVGQQTAGVSTLFQIYPVFYRLGGIRASVRYPVGSWLTPNGENIGGIGLTPDITVAQESLNIAFFPDPKVDPQLAAAVQVLAKTAP